MAGALSSPLLVHLQIFDANGPVGAEHTTALNITEAAIAALDTGRFVAARIFSSAGPIGQPIQVNTLTGGQRFSLSAAATSGPGPETTFVAWTDDSNASPDTSGRAIKRRPLAIAAAGF